MNEKRAVFNGYTEHYLTGKEIKEYFKNSYLLFGKHHSQISSYKLNFPKFYPKIKDEITYRVFLNDTFCNILDANTDNKIYFFGYTSEKPSWAKD